MFKLPGIRNDSPLMELSKQLEDDRIERYNNVEAEAIIKVENAYIDYRSKYDDKYPARPYLVFIGECKELQGDLPKGVSNLSFYAGNVMKSDVIYEFSNDELATMAGQGLFNKEFKIPKEFIGAEINVPVKCDFTVITPEHEDDIPLMFASIKDSRHIEISTENSDWAFGYEFDDAEIEYDNSFDDDRFVSKDDFESTFGAEKSEEQEAKEEKTIKRDPVSRLLRASVDEIYENVKAKTEKKKTEEKIEEIAEAEVKIEEDLKETEAKPEKKTEEKFFDESKFDEFDKEDEERLNQKVAEEKTEKSVEKEKDEEYVRRLADETGLSVSEVQDELGL